MRPRSSRLGINDGATATQTCGDAIGYDSSIPVLDTSGTYYSGTAGAIDSALPIFALAALTGA